MLGILQAGAVTASAELAVATLIAVTFEMAVERWVGKILRWILNRHIPCQLCFQRHSRIRRPVQDAEIQRRDPQWFCTGMLDWHWQ